MLQESAYGEVVSTICRYWRAVEEFRYQDALTFLDRDIEFAVNAVVRGRDAVGEVYKKRPSNLRVRHLITNFVVDPEGDAYRTVFLLTAFGRLIEEGETVPFITAPPALIADIDATLVRSEDGLKIKKLTSSVMFHQKH